MHEFHNKNQEATDFAMLINNLNAADHELLRAARAAAEDLLNHETAKVSTLSVPLQSVDELKNPAKEITVFAILSKMSGL